ncbi:hypothetical protein ITX54_04255 [Rouxiella silvae]|uniref:P68 RBP/TagC-like beta-propeller domain-containing protein n=1 Tax=Rouxiella silvae TaxID=1646373 RepID=A0AA40WZT3_9GAMM|nr:hypothetical protein [Rouxiella silvae]MBF6635874.1 hypothetical protein [Rouxiella silvae]
MNRRYAIKAALSAIIVYQLRPYPLFSQANKPSENKMFYDFDKRINNSIVGWDFGLGMHNFQYHAFDTINRHLYTLQHFTRDSKGGKISRFNMDISGGELRALDAQHYDTDIGHQMLSVENSDHGVKLWAAKGLQESLSVIRFNYTPSGVASNIEEYTMLDPNEFGSFYITGNLSFDQKWVIVRGKSKESSKFNGMNCIAIFDLEKLVKHGPGNVWHLAKYIWPYDYYQNNPKNTGINPQSIFSDGKYIYLLFGPSDITKPNLLRLYSFEGQLLHQSSALKFGREEALKLSDGISNELEGAQIVRLSPQSKPVLTIGYVRGGPKYYKGIYIVEDISNL